MSSKNIKILIADDHLIVRYGVILLIKEILPAAVFYEANTFGEAKTILSEQQINLLILDINIPGGDNIKMLEAVKLKSSTTRILMFSAYSEQLYALRYIQAGAHGYVHKDTSEAEIKRAVQVVLAGKTFLSELVKEQTLHNVISGGSSNSNIEALSNRELDVARLLIKGMGILDIASTLNLQMTTISTYKKRIFEKLQVANIVELINQFEVLEETT